jgi:alpha-tubulin suppressor-like RCC1 family protein
MVSAGRFHTLAIDGSGGLWAWGANSFGQLGDGTTTRRTSPVRIWSRPCEDCELYPCECPGPAIWSDLPGIKQVSAGNAHTLALKTDGSLWAWGANYTSQLGDDTNEDRHAPLKIKDGIAKISAGGAHSLALDTDGGLWAWGDNILGQLGVLDAPGHAIPEVPFWRYRHPPLRVKEDTVFTYISAGAMHSLAIDEDGRLWSWGENASGQLGLGFQNTGTHQTTPQQVGTSANWASVTAGTFNSFAIDKDGTLWGWGYNFHGELGNGKNGSGSNEPEPVKIKDGIASVSPGVWHTIAVDTDGRLWSWGSNDDGQLGDGTNASKNRPEPIETETETRFASVSASSNQSFAICETGSLWAWGRNVNGQLGDGTTENRNVPGYIKLGTVFTSIATSGTHSLAIEKASPFTDYEYGNLWAWGNNQTGQIGDGSTEQRNLPVIIWQAPVPYTDADGSLQICYGYTLYTGQTTLAEGWYVVNGAQTAAERIQINGDVHIILGADSDLFANLGIQVDGDNSLTVYQQISANAGRLTAVLPDSPPATFSYAGIGGSSYCFQSADGGFIAINGGIVTARGLSGSGIGGFDATVTINGGIVTAIGGIYGSTVNVPGLWSYWTNSEDSTPPAMQTGHGEFTWSAVYRYIKLSHYTEPCEGCERYDCELCECHNECIIYGDVDGDGHINSADVTLLRRYVAAEDKPGFLGAAHRFCLVRAKVVDEDAPISAADITLLRRYIATASGAKPVLGPGRSTIYPHCEIL